MTAKELERLLLREGWRKTDQKGSHAHYIHPVNPVKLTVPQHSGKDLKPGTLARILKDADLD